MIRVKIKPFFHLREILGGKELLLQLPPDSTVLEVIEELDRRSNHRFKQTILDETAGRIRPYFRIMLEGRDLNAADALSTRLSDGDTIALFPPVAGG